MLSLGSLAGDHTKTRQNNSDILCHNYLAQFCHADTIPVEFTARSGIQEQPERGLVMPKAVTETAAERLERMVQQFVELEDLVTQDLFPTIQSIVDYFNVLDHYDAEKMLMIRGEIEAGADPTVYYSFLRKHKLPFRKHRSTVSKAELN